MGRLGKRTALLIVTDTYADETFRQLRAPQADADALAGLLADGSIGGYEVTVLVNVPAHEAARAVEDVFLSARLDDLVLIYISGHGVKDEEGGLYFVATNSLHDRLASTAISAEWVRKQMERTRSRRIMIWLDCCYAGAFPRGARHRAGRSVDVPARLGGRGCAVMTSSSALEYSFESGDGLATDVRSYSPGHPSVFTGALVEGLRTGEADLGEDGWIDIDELYEYTYQRVRTISPKQTPTLDSKVEGKLYVAASIRPRPEQRTASASAGSGEGLEPERGAHWLENVVSGLAKLVTIGILIAMLVYVPPGPVGESSGGCDISKGELAIGIITSLSGLAEKLGGGTVYFADFGISNSVQLAVGEANRRCSVPGYELTLRVEDDHGDPQQGERAAKKLSSEPNLVGVVGTKRSVVAWKVLPVLESKKIAMISPANTTTELTRGQGYVTNPKRQFSNYFRVSPTDDLQGRYAAHYLRLNGKVRFAVLKDGTEYGEGLAADFEYRAVRDGGKILVDQEIDPSGTDFSSILGQMKNLDVEAVYFGGQYAETAGRLSRQMADLGLGVPLVGGDGILIQEFITQGGRQGDLATDDGADPKDLPGVKLFEIAYNKAFNGSYGSYGAFAYDAANALIGSLAKTVESGPWSEARRGDLLQNLGSYEQVGATGTVKFDQYGDTVNKLMTIWVVTKDGEWASLKPGLVPD